MRVTESTKSTCRMSRAAATLLSWVVAGVIGLAVFIIPAPSAFAAGSFSSAAIADKALTYVGRKGGVACADSHKPGDSGGQCRAFVNCIVWMVSGGTMNLGDPNQDYFRPLVAKGTEIKDINALAKGDIVQDGQGTHTFIVVGRVTGNTFDVVDSNHDSQETVMHYHRQVVLDANQRGFRMGTVNGGPSTDGQPFGHLDEVQPAPGGVNLRGWAIDPDTDAPIQVHFYAGDGAAKPGVNPSMALTANASRPDVAQAFPHYSANHGYSGFFPLPSGRHTVCAYGINFPAGGNNPQLGCITVTVDGQPFGHLDEVQPAPGGVNLRGWAIDPDTDAPIQVHFYAGDGAAKPGVNPSMALTANASRPDVAQAFPHYSANHGYSGFFPLPSGRHTVCAYGINFPAGGNNPQLGCITVTVPAPAPEPFAPARGPVALTMGDGCVHSGPCQIIWTQPDLRGGQLAYYEINGARNGRDLPTLHSSSTTTQYAGTQFGSCGATVVQVKAVTKRSDTGALVSGATSMANTVETGCNPPLASITDATLIQQGDHQAIMVTINEPTNGAGTCLVRVNTVAKWTGNCGQNQPGHAPRSRTATILLTERAPSYSLTVTATNSEGSDTSATTTLKNTAAATPTQEISKPPNQPQPTSRKRQEPTQTPDEATGTTGAASPENEYEGNTKSPDLGDRTH